MTNGYTTISAADAPNAPAQCSGAARGGSVRVRLAREPLLRFMLVGALIFLAAHVAQAQRTEASQQIAINPQVAQRLIAVSQLQDGVTPGPKQLAVLEDQYVEDEVLYREALRRGLDRDDEIVRRRLVQKMRYIEHDLAVPSAPSERVLRAYYANHAALFTAPESVAFEQIYFSPDSGGWPGARARALRARTGLASGSRRQGAALARLGDEFPVQAPPGELTRADAERLFGETGIVAALFDGSAGRWSQPIRSGYGWHLIQVTHRSPARVLPFSEVREEVQADWTQDEAQRLERGELDALRARYQVLRTDSRDATGK